jgi:hypothetical protein
MLPLLSPEGRKKKKMTLSRLGLLRRIGGSEWGSNPPATGSLPPAGFEDRDDHRTACASELFAITLRSHDSRSGEISGA